MTGPITPWAEHARNEWASLELRPPETDEEPYPLPRDGADADLLDGAVVVTAIWLVLLAVVGAALAAVLGLLGLRTLVGKNGS